MSQLRHHRVTAAHVWWLNLILELATVSITHVTMKNGKYQNNRIKVMTRKLLASLFCEQSVRFGTMCPFLSLALFCFL